MVATRLCGRDGRQKGARRLCSKSRSSGERNEADRNALSLSPQGSRSKKYIIISDPIKALAAAGRERFPGRTLGRNRTDAPLQSRSGSGPAPDSCLYRFQTEALPKSRSGPAAGSLLSGARIRNKLLLWPGLPIPSTSTFLSARA